MSQPIYINDALAREHTSFLDAISALKETLQSDFDPEKDPIRPNYKTNDGEFLLMPSWSSKYVGVKVLTITPNNMKKNLPLIYGLYNLFDSETGKTLATFDCSAITNLRTPANSCLAISLALRKEENEVVLFGAGNQGKFHIQCLSAITKIKKLTIVDTFLDRCHSLAKEFSSFIPEVIVGDNSAVSTADIIICCSTSAVPLFSGLKVPDHVIVVAMGAYTPDKRETDSELCKRSFIFVESHHAALSEAGDLIQAMNEGAIKKEDIHLIKDIVTGKVQIPKTGPVFFKSVGMSWEDLVVGGRIFEKVNSK